jgi:hypothetical protein
MTTAATATLVAVSVLALTACSSADSDDVSAAGPMMRSTAPVPAVPCGLAASYSTPGSTNSVHVPPGVTQAIGFLQGGAGDSGGHDPFRAGAFGHRNAVGDPG